MKIALITGAGSGIGAATTQALVQAQFQVVLAGRRENALQEVAQQADPSGTHTFIVPTDITQPEEVDRLFRQIIEKFGRLDVLFNNAGTNVPGVLLEELTLTQWKQVIDTNLTGAFLCTQAAFKIMKAQAPQGGRIINNGSLSAHVPRPNSAPYTASKHAITGLTRSTSLDGRKYNIACGQIDIGNALTPMAARMQKGVPQADGSMKVEPTIDVAQVAQAVVQMASLPLETNVQFMTIMATKMPFIGRG